MCWVSVLASRTSREPPGAMLRCLALALLLLAAPRPALAGRAHANHSQLLAEVQHLMYAIQHDHRLPTPILPNLAFDFEYELLNLTASIGNGPHTIDPADLLVFLENLTSKRIHRYRRESHSLIGTFDISKMFKKRKYKSKQDADQRPSASSLHGEQLIQTEGAEPPAAGVRHVAQVEPTAVATSVSEAPTTLLNSFTIPARLIPTESFTIVPLQTSSTTAKLRLKAKSSRKSKSLITSTNAPTSSRRETRLIPKKKVSENETVWPVKHAAVVEGDIILGGLMMVSLSPCAAIRHARYKINRFI